MNKFLLGLLNQNIKNIVENVYRVQEKIYGVYVPPTLKQVMTMKELLIKTGLRKEVNPDEFVGLTKIECKLIINELKKILVVKEEKLNNTTDSVVINI